MIQINGIGYEKDKIVLKEFMEENKIQPTWVAVELNSEILSKSEYDTTVLKSGDVVEILNFVGGG